MKIQAIEEMEMTILMSIIELVTKCFYQEILSYLLYNYREPVFRRHDTTHGIKRVSKMDSSSSISTNGL